MRRSLTSYRNSKIRWNFLHLFSYHAYTNNMLLTLKITFFPQLRKLLVHNAKSLMKPRFCFPFSSELIIMFWWSEWPSQLCEITISKSTSSVELVWSSYKRITLVMKLQISFAYIICPWHLGYTYRILSYVHKLHIGPTRINSIWL